MKADNCTCVFSARSSESSLSSSFIRSLQELWVLMLNNDQSSYITTDKYNKLGSEWLLYVRLVEGAFWWFLPIFQTINRWQVRVANQIASLPIVSHWVMLITDRPRSYSNMVQTLTTSTDELNWLVTAFCKLLAFFCLPLKVVRPPVVQQLV